MCGIAGFYGTGSREVLEKMTDVISYRGPDDRGFYFDGRVGLGHRRLSIIDTSTSGHQPLTNADASIWISFNGEIYNHRSLKKDLKGAHSFKGTSDTEVIVHLYQEYGTRAFEMLEGMFAFALYDVKKGKLYLVRDRMGEKPLYYAQVGTTLIFGSEQKSILEHPLFHRTLDLSSLHRYLSFEYVPTPHSFFAGIKKLPPASVLSFAGVDCTVRSYWDLSRTFLQQSTHDVLDEHTVIKGFGDVFSGAVAGCLTSDVPVGIFLSGGIDSSAVAYFAQQQSAVPIDTFSIGFHDPSFDESAYARIVAQHLGTRHHEKFFTATELLQTAEDVVARMDEPLSDPSLLPTYLLSQFTREHVKVALGGDGGDELLCGYDTFQAEKYAQLMQYVPGFVQTLVRTSVGMLPTSFDNMSLDFKLKKFMSGFAGDERSRHIRWLGSFAHEEKKYLYTTALNRITGGIDSYADLDTYVGDVEFPSSMARLQMLYQRTYLLDDILTKVDRASMLNSLEVRAPFLHHHVVEYLNQLPSSYKLRGSTSKYILKELLRDVLPATIVDRKKKGFGIPLARWLNKELRPLCEELLSREVIERRGLFEYAYVQMLLDEHRAERADHKKKIWTLMVLEMWFRTWMPDYTVS